MISLDISKFEVNKINKKKTNFKEDIEMDQEQY